MKIYIKRTLGSAFEPLDTCDKPLGKGGQATVYKIQTKGSEDFCLKKFNDNADAVYDRIAYMIKNPPKNIMSNSSFRVCWPTALAYDAGKKFIGYVMPLAFDNSRDLLILDKYNAKPISQQAKYKKYPDWFDKFELDTVEGIRNRIKMLCNWAIAIYSLHETGRYVIVDLKPENVMATSSGKISIVDTDSFQITENGKIIFPGPMCTMGYIPPEGKDLQRKKLPFTTSCDCFSASVCFYKILTGAHPYSGTIKKHPYTHLETEQEAIDAGLYVYGEKMRFLEFNKDFNLHRHFENLSIGIQNLFGRAFGSDPSRRPTMEEWGRALHEAAVSDSIGVRAVAKPKTVNSLSIKIHNVEFADFTQNGSVIRDYGSKLYDDITFLKMKLYYEVLKINNNVDLRYKILSPSGNLSYGSSSPGGFTASENLKCSQKGRFVCSLLGWGSSDKTIYKETGLWTVELYEGDKCIYKTSLNVLPTSKPVVTPPKPSFTPPPPPKVSGSSSVTPPPPKKKGKSGCGCVWLLFIVGALWAAYHFWYKDYKRDKDASRTYLYTAGAALHSTTEPDDNVIDSIPYGAELITYSDCDGTDGAWAHVKVNGKTGYVRNSFITTGYNFSKLDSVWGNDESRNIVADVRYRNALISNIISNGFITGTKGWQLFAQPEGTVPNSVVFTKLKNGYDEYPSFAFILSNSTTGKRYLAIYSFDSYETPILVYSTNVVLQGDIKSVSYNRRRKTYSVKYANAVSRKPSNTGDVTAATKTEAKTEKVSKVENKDLSNSDNDNKTTSVNAGVQTGQHVEAARVDDTDNTVYSTPDVSPSFANGGEAGLMRYLSANLKYPPAALAANVQGRVVVSFVVEKDGNIKSAKIIKGVDPELDREALRVVLSMPRWNPGMRAGRPVRTQYTLPVSFRLR